jgi:tetratricopeptide (TPR) repeat protein
MRANLARLVLGLALCLPASGWSATDPQFDEGVKLLKQLEYVRAIQAFEKALEAPGNTAAQRAKIHVQIGIARSGLTEYDAAEASFKKALTEDRTIEIPANTSPKIRALFEKVRAELRAPRPPDTPPPPATASPLDADEDDEEDDLAGPVTKSSTTKTLAWVSLGVGVAAGGTALVMGLMNLSEKSKAEDPSVFYSEAQGHADSAASYGLAANVLFGVAGAAAVTTGVLFYLAHRKKGPPSDVSAAVVPTPSGVAVQFGLRR